MTPWFLEDLVAKVPANCTDRLQPLNLSVNKPVKSHMKHLFQLCYGDEVTCKKKIKDKSTPRRVIDLKLNILKPLGLKWLEEAYHYAERNDFSRNGFVEAGINAIVSELNTSTNPIHYSAFYCCKLTVDIIQLFL